MKIRDFNIDDGTSLEKNQIKEESSLLGNFWMLSSETAYVADVQYALRGDADITIERGENKIPFPLLVKKIVKF